MADKNDKIKLIGAIVVLAAAAVILTVQYWPKSEVGGQADAGAAVPAETVMTDKSGAKIVRQGTRYIKESPPAK